MEIKKTIFQFIFCFAPLLMYSQIDMYQTAIYENGADTLRYRIMYPKDFSETEKFPVVLFLHGAGERGNDNKKQLVHGSSLFADDMVREKFPAIVIFPQCPQEDYWSSVAIDRTRQPLDIKFQYGKGPTKALQLAMDLIDSIAAEPYIKKDQIYVMGLSMGGMGTFEILHRKPDMFAAAVPICGGGDTLAAKAYADKVPLWIFHGAQDNVVAPQFSLDMTAKIVEYGGHPNLTIYGEANHNSWDLAFKEPGLLEWLFSNKLKQE